MNEFDPALKKNVQRPGIMKNWRLIAENGSNLFSAKELQTHLQI